MGHIHVGLIDMGHIDMGHIHIGRNHIGHSSLTNLKTEYWYGTHSYGTQHVLFTTHRLSHMGIIHMKTHPYGMYSHGTHSYRTQPLNDTESDFFTTHQIFFTTHRTLEALPGTHWNTLQHTATAHWMYLKPVERTLWSGTIPTTNYNFPHNTSDSYRGTQDSLSYI